MKAIEFVVRDSAGGLQRGTIEGDSQLHVITAGAGQEISLNLRQVDLQDHQRVGSDLVMTLVDGRVVTIENYFNDNGAANRLFISSDGYLNEVAFVDTDGGSLFAQFGPTEQWGKWSPSDDLIFLGRTDIAAVGFDGDNEVSMLAAPLLGAGLFGGGAGVAAAAVGGAAVIGGLGGGGGEGTAEEGGDGSDPSGGGDGGDTTGGGGGDTGSGGGSIPIVPFVNDPDASSDIGGTEATPQEIVVSGGGPAGAAVVVTIGDKTQETIIGDGGTFEVTFAGDDFPSDGSHEAVVTVTNDDGTSTLDGPSYVIDTTPPAVEVLSGTQSTQDFFNSVSFSNGVTLTGSGEAGASIAVTISGITQTTTVTSGGSWSVTWPAGTLDPGEYSTGATIVSTDSFGNSTTVNETLVVDTVTEVTVETQTVETDGTVNGAERLDGVTLTGTAQPGSTVFVSFGSGTHQATVNASGQWQATFTMNEIPSGETTATVTATATDTSGNTSTTTGQVDIDTLVRDFGFTGTTGGADGVINIAEATETLVMTGTTEPGSSVLVTMNGFTHTATVSSNGSWSVNFMPNEIPTGTLTTVMTAVATDAAGNSQTITRDVAIDRDAGVLTISAAPVETDNVINQAEASDGVVLTGTSNPGATVTVSLAGISQSVIADGAGNWFVNFSNSQVTPGVYTAQITATTTDSAGNTLNAQDSVQVDTRVDNLSIAADQVEGDGTINGFERLSGGGAQISGTTEAGSTSVVVELNGVSVNAAVSASGNWTATFAANQIAEGTYTAQVSATATDAAGNVATVTDNVRVDTEVVPLNMTQSGGGRDGVANFEEAASGIDLSGQVEPGSNVVVNFDGTNFNAVVSASGSWSLTIPPSAIRGGTYDAAITVTATDMAGNVDSINDTLAIDTDAPEGPVIASYTRDGDGIRGISTEMNDGDLAVHQVSDTGAVSQVTAVETDIPAINETNFQFNSNVPDGSHLIVTATDAAGNSSGTYLVLDDEVSSSQVELSNASLGQYNIETADLSFAEEAKLTLDEAALLNLSQNSDELTVLGDRDDTVTITGATRSGSTVKDGERFDIYNLGDEGTVLIDDQVNVII